MLAPNIRFRHCRIIYGHFSLLSRTILQILIVFVLFASVYSSVVPLLGCYSGDQEAVCSAFPGHHTL